MLKTNMRLLSFANKNPKLLFVSVHNIHVCPSDQRFHAKPWDMNCTYNVLVYYLIYGNEKIVDLLNVFHFAVEGR